MFIAHVPAGYLLSRALPAARRDRIVARAAVVGSVFPDVDLLWAYGVKLGRVHHHTLPTHIPAVWLVVGAAALVLARAAAPRHVRVVAAFLAGGGLHLMLDTFVGDVMWAWPLSDRFVHVVTVPATHRLWLLSFALHWTFLVEIGICLTAAAVWRARRRRPA